MWSYEFTEMGGYDCMSDSIDIACGGKVLIVLDLANFGQRRTAPAPSNARAAAEALAAKIVADLNAAQYCLVV
jgi:hypothetical protein